jgi:hypothetical protein
VNSDKIVTAVPGFRARWISFLNEWAADGQLASYIGMSELAHYVVDAHSQGHSAELASLFCTVQEILQNPENEAQGIARRESRN